MRKQEIHITPEVEHLLAAVKAVKRGVIPERATNPQHEPDEIDKETDNENEETPR